MSGQLKAEHEYALTQAAQTTEELKQTHQRLKGIRVDDKAVGDAVDAAVEIIERVRAMADNYTAQAKLLIKELDTYPAPKT